MSGTDPSRHPYLAIWRTVARVPRGRVATYGQIASVAGLDGQARLVGYALHRLPEGARVPWHRVIAAGGRISLPPERGGATQRRKLVREGITFDARGRVHLAHHLWRRGSS